jgi:hypothetical protein
VEKNTLAQVEGPLGQVFVGFIRLCQGRFHGCAADFVSEQRLSHLLAGTQRLAVGFIRAVQRDRFGVLHPDEGILSGDAGHGEALVAKRTGMSTFHSSLVRHTRTAPRYRDHRDVLFDGIVGGLIMRSTFIVGCKLSTCFDGFHNVIELITELVGRTSAEVVTKEVGLVGIVSTPTEQVNAGQLTGVRCVEEGTGFHHLNIGGDVQVLLQLGLNILSHNVRVREIATDDVTVVNNGFKTIGIARFGE